MVSPKVSSESNQEALVVDAAAEAGCRRFVDALDAAAVDVEEFFEGVEVARRVVGPFDGGPR